MNRYVIPDSAKSLREIILWAEKILDKQDIYFGHGTDNALDEAAYLISYCADLPADFGDDKLEIILSDKQRLKVADAMFERIENKIPVAYITGKAWFFGLEFEVNEHVLVPRSPLAELIAEHFSPWFDNELWATRNDRPLDILDMCTGSGCIAIACATAFENASVDAVDISPEALKIAEKNIAKHNLQTRVHAICSDMFSDLAQKKYDIIISNPPYVSREEINALPDEYHKEPDMGLFADNNGLQFAITLLKNASKFLSDEGIIVIEVGNSEQALQKYYPDIAFTWLEFERGGQGVLLLDAAQIRQYQEKFLR